MAVGNLIKEGSEDAVQAEVVRWARDNEVRFPELVLLHSIPNAGFASKKQGALRKLTGRVAGMPDLHLPIRRGEWYGLWIELKRTPYRDARGKLQKAKVSADQKRVMGLLREQSHRVEVCEGAQPAIELLESYLTS